VTPPDDLLTVDLAEEEMDLLRAGLGVWGGPATCSKEMAVAMGFGGSDFLVEVDRIRHSLWASNALVKADWTRALLVTEIAFTSLVVGAAWDWRIVTGFDDPESFQVLRSLQSKLSGAGALVSVGTYPPPDPDRVLA
jgi:hypothetical protein